jgi:hypothetical protein
MTVALMARRIFRGAAIYGMIVLPPMLFAPWPEQGPEQLVGFVGLALVFQFVFWMIGGDPVRYRPVMLAAIAEKLVFGIPALVLVGLGRTAPVVGAFAAMDVVLAIAFWIAFRATPDKPAA